MSEEIKDGGAVPNDSASGHSLENGQVPSGNSDSVKYDTYKRTLTEAKKFKNLNGELQEKLQTLEQEKLQAEGKTQELLQNVSKERDELKTSLAQAHGAFANGRAMDTIVDEAVQMGCASTSLLKKAVGEKVKELEFDDEYRPNKEQVKMILDEVRREEPLLFTKPGPNIADHTLNTSTNQTKGKTLKNMNEQELNEYWQRNGNR